MTQKAKEKPKDIGFVYGFGGQKETGASLPLTFLA